MNYNMQGIMESVPKALRDAEIGEARNQEKNQVLMVDKTTCRGIVTSDVLSVRT